MDFFLLEIHTIPMAVWLAVFIHHASSCKALLKDEQCNERKKHPKEEKYEECIPEHVAAFRQRLHYDLVAYDHLTKVPV